MRTMVSLAGFSLALSLFSVQAADIVGPYFAEKAVLDVEYRTLVELHERVSHMRLDAELELDLLTAEAPNDQAKRAALEKRVEVLSTKVGDLRKQMLSKQLEARKNDDDFNRAQNAADKARGV